MPERDEPPQPPPVPSSPRNRALGAGYTLVGGLLVGLGIGWAIDTWRESSPAWTVGCAVVFLLIGFYQVVKDALR
jgi:F0F1-type ATP synthase assembly protein I